MVWGGGSEISSEMVSSTLKEHRRRHSEKMWFKMVFLESPFCLLALEVCSQATSDNVNGGRSEGACSHNSECLVLARTHLQQQISSSGQPSQPTTGKLPLPSEPHFATPISEQPWGRLLKWSCNTWWMPLRNRRVSVGKRRLLEKGSSQKHPLSRDSRDLRSPQSVDKQGASDNFPRYPGEIRDSRDRFSERPLS